MNAEDIAHLPDAANVNEITHSLTTTPTEAAMSSRRRVDTTMDAIKAYIIQERLQPGDPLPTESYLCEYLKSARSSVREALRKLEALDIVSVVHGKGTFVGALSLDPLVEALSFRAMIPNADAYGDLADIVELRKILDQGLAPQIIEGVHQLSEEDINRLRELIDEMSACARDGKTFLQQDIAFHQGLMDCVDNAVARQLTQSLWLVHMAVVPALNSEISVSLEQSAQSHRDILESALNGDAEGYRSAVAAHYRPIEQIIHTRTQ
ncbi:GntR family transcriptional regulator [Alloscardovia macacae]|uniref:GntR family transcriptional regulator n=1 Tax=Alloscardovia macacae TaxID=1160091 RepID=A0A1Y2SZK1_9BIFI|nr:FCD domain-containing protein [Alloscardovia macacae]OTA25972.1 GntR family transcriptional regulator [Alloscardovia macacae]OTA28739.1 GntR family transcriptional regulator [Alloscardovia macacae]